MPFDSLRTLRIDEVIYASLGELQSSFSKLRST
jgi:hypothetical protein